MPPKKTLELAFKKLQGLRDRFALLEKDVKTLKDILNIHDNWHSEIRSMMGETVRLRTRSGTEREGVLVWSDRYNLCLRELDRPRRIYNKGCIEWVEPAR